MEFLKTTIEEYPAQVLLGVYLTGFLLTLTHGIRLMRRDRSQNQSEHSRDNTDDAYWMEGSSDILGQSIFWPIVVVGYLGYFVGWFVVHAIQWLGGRGDKS